jgi:putative tryptophan/tyrosine transport system substrate-binding protein
MKAGIATKQQDSKRIMNRDILSFRLRALFFVLTCLSALLFGLNAYAQAQAPGKILRIAVFAYDQQRASMESFFEELNRFGYVAGQNATIELWNAEGRAGRLAELAEEIDRFKPDVVLASSTPAALAAKKSMPTMPIVFALVADPVGAGMVASLANPGGNLTGLTNINVELSGKRTELLMETFPAAKLIGVLSNPSDPISAPQLKEVDRVTHGRRVKVEIFNASEPKDLQNLPTILVKKRLDAMTLISSQLFSGHRTQLVSMATATKTPAIYWTDVFVNSGGLMSYGVNVPELYRRAAYYVDKILKGAKPADLPVEQPTKFELVINLKTAKEIGITIPPNVLARADRVIK